MDAFKGLEFFPYTRNKYIYANSSPSMYTDPSGYIGLNSINAEINGASQLARTVGGSTLRLFSKGVKKPEKLTKLSLKWRLWVYITRIKVRSKIPKEWGKPKLTSKAAKKGRAEKPGLKWRNGKADGVRIDKGNPKSQHPSQRVDHFRIANGGRLVDRNGNRLPGGTTVQGAWEETHIPLKEWLRWRFWNKP